MPADRDSVETSVECSTQKTSFQENFNLRRSSRVCRPIDRFLKHALVYFFLLGRLWWVLNQRHVN